MSIVSLVTKTIFAVPFDCPLVCVTVVLAPTSLALSSESFNWLCCIMNNFEAGIFRFVSSVIPTINWYLLCVCVFFSAFCFSFCDLHHVHQTDSIALG